MPRANINGIEIEFETHGNAADPCLLLVMGYTAQLTAWPDGLIDRLVDASHHVVRFDNRDAGLSSKTEGDAPDVLSILAAAQSGDTSGVDAPYSLSDMAADAVGLLDHLEIEQVHAIGASMGGMIVQHLAIEHSNRLKSATSIMSTTGASEVGDADPEVVAAMLTPPPAELEAAIAQSVEVSQLLGGPLWRREEAERRARVAIERSFHPRGGGFQLAAIAASGDRTERLGAVDLPFLAIHGRADRLIKPSGGEATAAAVPGADLLMLDAMGHDLPAALWPQLAGAITGIAARGESEI